MANYHNKKETRKIGLHIRTLRESKELSVEDVASMSGFSWKTIRDVENGSNADTSHLIEIARAIGVHPKELFDVPMEIKSRFKLSPKRIASNKLTYRLNKLITDTAFFDKPKFVREVVEHLKDEYSIEAEVTHTSVALQRMVKSGTLKYTKVGRQNHYTRSKRPTG